MTNKATKDANQNIHEKLTSLKKKTDPKSKVELAKVVTDLAQIGKENYDKLKHELGKVKSNKGGMNTKQIWR